MFKTFIILGLHFALSGVSPVQAGAYEHLREAMHLNRERAPLYSVLTAGESEELSRRMIRKERNSLPGALLLDLLAKPYQRHGIPIAKVEFVSMAKTPAFAEHYAFTPEPISEFRRVNAEEMKSRFRQIQKTQDFAEVSRFAASELKKLEAPFAYHCMMRHMLESILRAANLAPFHAAQARAKGLPSSAWLSWLMIKGQVRLLSYAADLDRDLAPIQSRNIPMLCQDVPAIPAFL